MLFFKKKVKESNSHEAVYQALDSAMARIEFTPDGIITDVNDNFLTAMECTREQIIGKHHKIFVDEKYSSSQAYIKFWLSLANGDFQQSEFKRRKLNGETVWLQATYNPVRDDDGNVVKVVKFAVLVTEEKLASLDIESQLAALNRRYAVIEFKPDGTILTANNNFLSAMGYELDEIQGQHHRIFMHRDDKESSEYQQFWHRLASGEAFSAQYRRVAKGHREIWIDATYNPVFDLDGNVSKVVKIASDITAAKLAQDKTYMLSLVADNTSDGVVITNAQGQIEYVNAGFEAMSKYQSDEVIGKKPGDFLQGKDTCKETVSRISQKLAANETFYEEILNYDRTGRPYWVGVSIDPVFDLNHQLSHFIALQTNVTKKRIETNEIDKRMKLVDLTNIVIEWDEGGYLQYTNQVADEELFSGFEHELVQKALHLDQILDKDEISALKKGKTFHKVLTIEIGDDVINVSANLKGLANFYGKFHKAVMYGTNISSRKQTTDVMTNVLDQINSIAEHISSVSDRNDLLALNATIEAARAGDAGKGFSVVASEVKSLSNRNSELSDEIALLISQVKDKISQIETCKT